jgi:molybdopterin molybdotransferase
MAQLSDDCFAFGEGLLDVDTAREMILTRIAPVTGIETISLSAALGRTLAKDIIAPNPVPRFANSAVDGYAVRYGDLNPEQDTVLDCTDRIAAGQTSGQPLKPGSAARIFTGAALPPGADTILMQEDCQQMGDRVTIRPGIKRGANVRAAGEDIANGAVALRGGRRLGPADLGIVAALGRTEVAVRMRLKVALFSTGNEIREPGSVLEHGQIFDANRFMLAGLLTRLNVAFEDRGIIPDDPARLSAALTAAASETQLIVTSGGVSIGEEDHIRAAIANHGSLYFWRLAIKPGRPVALGQIDETPLVGLPGNPVAALLSFALIARPMIEALSGTTPEPLRRFGVPSDFAYAKKAGRREYVRVSLHDGRARRHLKDGSAMLTSLSETDGLVELPSAMTRLEAGDAVDFIPYSELI